MLQLLNPIGLLALTALVIPVLVHLWKLRKGKTLRVGSISLLQDNKRQRSSKWQIRQWPLFLLRCVLLVLLAILLAKPLWNREDSSQRQAGWILVPGHQLAAAKAEYGARIDSLLAAGLELHNLSPGFEPLQWQDTARINQLPGTNSDTTLSTWSLLKALDAHLPKGFSLYLFADTRVASFHGDRPGMHSTLHWYPLSTDDSPYHTPPHSWVTAEGKIKSREWISTPEGNYYEENKDNTTVGNNIDTSIIRISLYPGKNTADAQYIKAAIQAIEDLTGRRLQLTTLVNGQWPPTPQNLVIGLNGQPDTSLLQAVMPQGTLFLYDTGQAMPLSSWQETGAGNNIRPAVYQYVPGPATGLPVWTLADGRPLLTLTEAPGGKRVFHYKSRFHPAWSDLVWEEAFVKTVFPWVVPATTPDHWIDRRTADIKQLMPQLASGTRRPPVHKEEAAGFIRRNHKDLSILLFILSFIALIVERILDYRLQQRQPDA